MKRSSHNLVTPGQYQRILWSVWMFLCAVYGKLRMKDVKIVCFMKIDKIFGDKEDKASLNNFDMAA